MFLLERTIFSQYVEDKYEDLEIHTSYKYDPATSICATYLWTENVWYPKDLVTATAYHTEGYKLWFKQGRFPIGIDGEATAHLLDNTPITVRTIIDSGASRPILNKHFYDAHPFLYTYPKYKIAPRGMVIGNDTVRPYNEAIAIMVKFSGHVFYIVVLLHCGLLSLNPFIEFRIWNNSSSSDVLYIHGSISISPKYKSKSKATSHCRLLLHDCTNVAV